jgi:hypothetical protein
MPVVGFIHILSSAAEFVRAKADVIVAQGTQAALAAKNATAALPIVFALPGDPVGSGLVASLARPGGNVTGLSSQAAELGGKRLNLLREIVPGLRRLAIMATVGNAALDSRAGPGPPTLVTTFFFPPQNGNIPLRNFRERDWGQDRRGHHEESYDRVQYSRYRDRLARTEASGGR